MSNYIPIVCFVVGLLVGMAAIYTGYKLGFRASYEIRNHTEEATENKGLFKDKKDPGEFDLLDEEEKKET